MALEEVKLSENEVVESDISENIDAIDLEVMKMTMEVVQESSGALEDDGDGKVEHVRLESLLSLDDPLMEEYVKNEDEVLI